MLQDLIECGKYFNDEIIDRMEKSEDQKVQILMNDALEIVIAIGEVNLLET